jgi:hypothetical protein
VNALDAYLSDLDAGLTVPGRLRRRIQAEVADHLASSLEREQALGYDRSEAESRAVRAFGAADRIARRFNVELASDRARRVPLLTFLTGVGVLATFLVQDFAMPRAPWRDGDVPLAVAVPMIGAMLALQVAVTAGAVTLARMLARRRTPALPAADRAQLWRGGQVAVAALGVTVTGWTVSSAARLGYVHGSPRPVILGAATMAALVVTAGALLRRRRALTDDDPGDDGPAPGGAAGEGGWLALPDAALALVRRFPRLAGAATAGLAAAGTFAHDETAMPMRLVDVAVEAAVVVAAFVLLGPMLGLRERRHEASR